MLKIISIVILAGMFAGCELIVIGREKSRPVIDISQKTPLGVVLLFKTELDSSNVQAAAKLLAKPGGSMYLAVEKYDLYDEIARVGRIIRFKPITDISSDSISDNSYNIKIKLDYLQTITCSTYRIDGNWFIIAYYFDNSPESKPIP